MEPAARDGEVGALLTDAGAVLVRHGGAAELDAVDPCAVAGDDPDRLALGAAARGAQVGATADAAQREVVLGPRGHVAVVLPGVDEHGVAVARHRRGLAGRGQLPVGPDPPRARSVVGVRRRGQRRGGREAEEDEREGEGEWLRGSLRSRLSHRARDRRRPRAGRP
ncbi:hypothetical protein [Nocardioides lacusdianchii]|uniref:hypothetical protein n=1 Tax=Nocardioides lacusdianchii TaxID=2783664 RepID=UPI001CC9D904|nr:hypothetical protein [Nocardioides lacusdianchii]